MVSRPALGLCPGRGSAGLDRAAWAPGCPAMWRGKVCLSVAGAPGISLLAHGRDQRDGAVRPSPASRAEDGDSSVPPHAGSGGGRAALEQGEPAGSLGQLVRGLTLLEAELWAQVPTCVLGRHRVGERRERGGGAVRARGGSLPASWGGTDLLVAVSVVVQ